MSRKKTFGRSVERMWRNVAHGLGVGQVRLAFGRRRRRLDRLCPDLGQIWPRSTKFAPSPTNIGRISTNFGRFRQPIFAQLRPKLGANSAKFGPALAKPQRPKLGRLRPNSGRVRANSGGVRPDLGRYRPTLDRFRLHLGRTQLFLGRIRATPERIRPPKAGRIQPHVDPKFWLGPTTSGPGTLDAEGYAKDCCTRSSRCKAPALGPRSCPHRVSFALQEGEPSSHTFECELEATAPTPSPLRRKHWRVMRRLSTPGPGLE